MDKKRVLGQHLTPTSIFQRFILPEIRNSLYDFVWIDLYAGEGNLILPILNEVSGDDRVGFFRDHVFLSDIQREMVEKCILKALECGIPENIARKRIRCGDNLMNQPRLRFKRPPYHITNPPYLYLGHIRKYPETRSHLKYFEGGNRGYQDLYQIAMMNDLRHGRKRMIYIIPSNFI